MILLPFLGEPVYTASFCSAPPTASWHLCSRGANKLIGPSHAPAVLPVGGPRCWIIDSGRLLCWHVPKAAIWGPFLLPRENESAELLPAVHGHWDSQCPIHRLQLTSPHSVLHPSLVTDSLSLVTSSAR